MKLYTHHWNTYAVTGYTHDVANDTASQGGVHIHQVKRLSATGIWLKRVVQSNGRHIAYGHVVPVTAEEGQALYEEAKAY